MIVSNWVINLIAPISPITTGTPDSGELVLDGVTLHATICVACCSHDTVQWLEFVEQKKLTPEKYRVAGSWNAPLPLHLVRMADEMYLAQTKYFSFR